MAYILLIADCAGNGRGPALASRILKNPSSVILRTNTYAGVIYDETHDEKQAA